MSPGINMIAVIDDQFLSAVKISSTKAVCNNMCMCVVGLPHKLCRWRKTGERERERAYINYITVNACADEDIDTRRASLFLVLNAVLSAARRTVMGI